MDTIYLKYSNDNFSTETAASFQGNYVEYPVAYRSKGTTLSQMEYSTLLATKKSWDVTIYPNETYKNSIIVFLIAFFKANAWKISFDNWSSEYNVILQNEGRMPMDLESNIRVLPTVSFELLQKDTD